MEDYEKILVPSGTISTRDFVEGGPALVQGYSKPPIGVSISGKGIVTEAARKELQERALGNQTAAPPTIGGTLKDAVGQLAVLNERLRNLRSDVGTTQAEKQGGNPSNPVNQPESLAAYANEIAYQINYASGVLADIEREIG
jgi:hypothetical protein